MSVDEMLASSDPYYHKSGERMALNYLTDKYGKTDLNRKLELANKIESQDILLKAYLDRHVEKEIKDTIKPRISDEVFAAFKFAYDSNATNREVALSKLKSDNSRFMAFDMMLSDKSQVTPSVALSKSDVCKKRYEEFGHHVVTATHQLEEANRKAEEEAKEKARKEGELIAQKEQDEINAQIIAKANAKVASFMQRWKEVEPSDVKISSIKDKSQSHKSQTLVMKGFYLGMPLQDAMTLFWSYTHFTAKMPLEQENPDFWMEKYYPAIEKSGERFGVTALRLRENQDTDLLIANIIGLCARVDEQYCVTKLVFDRNMVDDMFGINNVDGKIFCQQLVENYPIIERMEYSTVQIEDEKARDRYLFGRVLDGSINMSNAFQAGYDTADMFKKWTDCYHYESKKGFRISVMAEEKESFLVLEKTQKVEKKNFD